jgi:hypothetical protein
MTNSTDDESSPSLASQSNFSDQGSDHNSNNEAVNNDYMFLLMGDDSDSEDDNQIREWNNKKKIENNKHIRRERLGREY